LMAIKPSWLSINGKHKTLFTYGWNTLFAPKTRNHNNKKSQQQEITTTRNHNNNNSNSTTTNLGTLFKFNDIDFSGYSNEVKDINEIVKNYINRWNFSSGEIKNITLAIMLALHNSNKKPQKKDLELYVKAVADHIDTLNIKNNNCIKNETKDYSGDITRFTDISSFNGLCADDDNNNNNNNNSNASGQSGNKQFPYKQEFRK
jgi:hypothetical protein